MLDITLISMRESGKEEIKIMIGVYILLLQKDHFHLDQELMKDTQIFNQP